MTVAYRSPRLAPASMPMAVNLLRSRGLRVSAARRLVLEALFAADRPVTADEVAQGLDGRFPQSDLASVYRNLDTLEEVGLVRHVHFGHGPGLYALSGADQHGYAACERCGAVTVLTQELERALRALVAERIGFEARFTHFPLSGACARCAGEDAGG